MVPSPLTVPLLKRFNTMSSQYRVGVFYGMRLSRGEDNGDESEVCDAHRVVIAPHDEGPMHIAIPESMVKRTPYQDESLGEVGSIRLKESVPEWDSRLRACAKALGCKAVKCAWYLSESYV